MLVAELGSIEKYIIIALATAGGFMLGFVFTGVVAHALNRFVFRRASSTILFRFARFGGGVAGAVLVYLLLSGEGGLGLGGAGGGQQQSNEKGDPLKNEHAKDQPKDLKIESPSSKGSADGENLTVYVLPIEVVGEIRYRINSQKAEMTLDQIVEWLENQSKSNRPIKLVDIDFVRDKGLPLPKSPSDGRLLLKAQLDKMKIKSYLVPLE